MLAGEGDVFGPGIELDLEVLDRRERSLRQEARLE